MLLKKWIQLLIVFTIIAFPLFLSLDKLPIVLWDESRLALNAFEMYKTGLSVVTTFHFGPETWNTKPPLLIWMQVLSFKLFGLHEVALRLPSVLAAVATCLVIYWFCNRLLKRPWLGILAIVMLVTSIGYMNYHHSTRTGDYDAMLTFFSTTYMLLFFAFLEEGKKKYLLLCFAAITGAVLTKGIAGLLFAPCLLVYTIYRNKLLFVLKQPFLYIGFLSFAGIVISYYLLREHYQPGYFYDVSANELGGRYIEVGVNTNGSYYDPHYYFRLMGWHFSCWYWLLPPAIILAAFAKRGKYRNAIWFLSVSSFMFLFILSNSTGKNGWYDIPIFPLLSIVSASCLISIYELVIERTKQDKKRTVTFVSVIVVIALVILPYYKIISTVTAPVINNLHVENMCIATYLKAILHGDVSMKDFTIVKNEVYEENITWYSFVLNEKGLNSKIIIVGQNDLENGLINGVNDGDSLILYQADVRHVLEDNYNVERKQVNDRLFIYHVKGKKNTHADSTINSSTGI